MNILRHRARVLLASAILVVAALLSAQAQDKPPAIDVNQKLVGFDAFMEKTLKDWNAPGVGVGIVIGDKLVFVKGYGYRDYEKKLPITAQTLYPIASNTKLFTAMSVQRWRRRQFASKSGSRRRAVTQCLSSPAVLSLHRTPSPAG